MMRGDVLMPDGAMNACVGCGDAVPHPEEVCETCARMLALEDENQRLRRELGEAFDMFAAAVAAVGGKVTIPDSFLVKRWTVQRSVDIATHATIYEAKGTD